ncbi:hypothetical protein GYMLUDRAFT_105705, partial [Collybiopsis luxurians FD-317 M1]
SYRIELLNEDNYLPWKCRVLAILTDKELLGYVNGTKISEWEKNDGKAQSQIILALGDSQMVHTAGAKTAAEMWSQITAVKESSGTLGIM